VYRILNPVVADLADDRRPQTLWPVTEAAGGGRFEEIARYVRVKRVGPFVWVAGTTAVEPSGRVHAPGDMEAQTRFALQRIDAALRDVGSSLDDVVRVRAYLTDLSAAGAFARVHGEMLGTARPVMTAVQAGLATPGLVVEIDVDAVVQDARQAADRPLWNGLE
jgi:enamine deaminase RidA (YjgF/YER057c/UK114 family)